jgi:hypothetical protein
MSLTRCDIRIANVQTPSDGILKIKPSPDAVGTRETIVAEDHDSRTLDFLVSRAKRGGYDQMGGLIKSNTRACVLLRTP